MNWVNVKDELPNYNVHVLWLREDGCMFIDNIDEDSKWEGFKERYEEVVGFPIGKIWSSKITHWMTLPALPIE